MQGRVLGAWKDIADTTRTRICVDEKVHLVLVKPVGATGYRMSTEPPTACDGSCKNLCELPAEAEEAVKQFLATNTPVATTAGS